MGTAACLLVVAAGTAGLIAGRGGGDASSSAAVETTITASPDEHTAVLRRDTRFGRLTVTRGPVVMPDHYDPFGPTDHWRERAECYAKRLYVRVGRFQGDVADVPHLMHGDGPAPYLLSVTTPSIDESLDTWVIFRAGTGRTFRLITSTGWRDEATSRSGIAVLVDRASRASTDPPVPDRLDVTIDEVVDGQELPLEIDVGSMEDVLYGGQANTCPEGPTTPSPTIALDPADREAAAAVAVAPFDPTVPVTVAVAGIAGPSASATARIAEVRKEMARFEGYLGPGLRAGVAPFWTPLSVTEGQVWVAVAPADAEGTVNPTRSWWVTVRRTEAGWRVDPEGLCNFLRTSILGGSKVTLADCSPEPPSAD